MLAFPFQPHPMAHSAPPPVAPLDVADASWLEAMEAACFGGGLPAAAEAEMRLAGNAWHDEAAAEAHLLCAFALAPEHPATHIGLYRFYFYRNRLEESLAVGLRCLAFAARLNGLAADWRDVRAGQAAFDDFAAVLPRFYLFTLKGCAYLSLRLGRFDQGAALLDKLAELDSTDKLGGSVLRRVLDRMGEDDDE